MYSIQIMRDNGSWHYVAGSGYEGEWLREAKLVQSANSIGSLTLSVLPSYPLLSELACNRRVRARDEETGEYVFYGRVIDTTPQMDEEGAVFTEVTCEDALGFLQDTAVWIDSRKGYFEGTNKTYPVEIDDEDETRTIASADLLSILVAQHNATVGDYHGDAWKKVSKGTVSVDTEDETTFSAEYEATTYEMLQDLAEDADWEYRSRYDGSTVYIDVADQLGGSGGTFRIGDNMASAALKSSMADVATRVFPYGKEYVKLDKQKRKGTKVTGRVKGEELESKGTMLRFPCEKSIKCVLTVGARKDGYAMVLFTSAALTGKNVKKVTVKKYTASKDSSEACTKRYPVPEDAKYVYVMGAGSECTTYGYCYNADGKAVKKNYRTDLGYWKGKLSDAAVSKILAKYGVTMGSVVDGSGDRSYFLSKNEDKYGVVEYSPVKEQSLATGKITNPKKAVYSIDDLKGANKAKARAFIKWACRKLKKKCNESCELTVTGYDLQQAGLAYDALRLYDTWTVVNDLAGINASAEVVRVERDLLKPWCVEVEMGSKVTRSSSSTRGNGLEGDGVTDADGDDDDSDADEYETLVNQYADAAEAAAADAVERADELDGLSRRIQVDSLAAGQMASEAYDTVHPITQAMRDALDQAESQAHELTAVKEAASKSVEVTNSLARAVATYSYETEKSVVAWKQTYSAALDAWASDDAETQAKIKAAYAKLYGADGTADSPEADSAQGHLDAAKAANVEAAAKEAEMKTALASANAYQASCVATAAAQQAAYEKALANYEALKKKTTAKKREIDAAWTALQASLARRDESQAAVDAANVRCEEAEANYAEAKQALAEAEAKVETAADEVQTAMDGIHEVYSSMIEQTAKGITLTASKVTEQGEQIGTLQVTATDISSTVEGLKSATNLKQTASGWTWSIVDSTARADAASAQSTADSAASAASDAQSTAASAYSMSYNIVNGTGTLTLGGKATAIKMGGSSSTITMGNLVLHSDYSAYQNYYSCYLQSLNTDGTVGTKIYMEKNNRVLFSGGIGADDIVAGHTNSLDYLPDHGGYGVFATATGYIEPFVGMMVGSGGSNHGIWSTKAGKWLIYATSAGAVTCNSGSSKWIKENVCDVSDEEAAKLLNVRLVTFDYKADGEAAAGGNRGWIGAIAEEVYPIIPRAVIQPEEPYDDLAGMIERGEDTSKLGIDYGTFTPYLIKLCQMQQRQIDALEARVAALEGASG